MKGLQFTSILRLLGMIGKWTKAADSYTAKLADSLEKHGFAADAKCVREHLRARRGEPVARATQDATEAEEITIAGWVARDKTGGLCLFFSCPRRDDLFGSWCGVLVDTLDPNFCPDVTWESDPKKVSVTIKAE